MHSGDLHYLQVGKPSLDVPLAIHMMNPDYGSVLSTGEPVGKSAEGPYVENFFRLHFNVYNTVETITCLSKKVRVTIIGLNQSLYLVMKLVLRHSV